MQETCVRSLGLEDPWRRKWQPTPVFLPRKFHGQRSLVGYSPCGCKELDTTEWAHMHAIYITFYLFFPFNNISWKALFISSWRLLFFLYLYNSIVYVDIPLFIQSVPVMNIWIVPNILVWQMMLQWITLVHNIVVLMEVYL